MESAICWLDSLFGSWRVLVDRDEVVPGWTDMHIRDHCKYLGFMVGPGRKNNSWHAPFKKIGERVEAWSHMPLGLFWDARIYNMFMLPTLGYVAQLEPPPKWLGEELART